ncbi:hypothetical protein SAMN05421721_10280 [Ectothiorhodospira mobilis]|uniref:Uncharacterized protein n=1 Tax=Ectothiorhodospira mobilis TaxID=195064 RepID=A0A1I4PPB4_ECTMO|nr:hypothetical protein [Ectothiorhodospira mobilis]SFM29215.1 hypothetical protein SAMN05421721_10280 [Ectothiorhodospira mobilis]
MNWFRFKGKPSAGRDEGISLGREDNERVERWQRAVKRVRVTRNLLKLAWTAGPVTGIGLYGGYYIGYGRPPATDLLIYFTTFTILSGLLGLLAAIVYDTTYGAAKERAQQDVLEAVDLLGDLILAVRDLAMEGFEPEIRRREAAMQLLQRVDLSPEAVAFACEELIGERELGRCLAKIDTFRRAGLYSRIRDLHQDQGEAFDKALSELHRVAPLAASVLRERYMGDAPKLQDGMPRDEFFLERVMAAIDQDNLLLMTPADVEAMLLLAFELINGREIPMLTFSYAGRWRLASVLDHLEEQRSRYRVARAAGSNRMRALATWLVEVEVLAYEEVPEGISASLLVDRVVAALDRLTRQLDAECDRLRRRRHGSTGELRRLGDTLATSLRLYRMAHDAYRELGRVHADLLRASEEWERLQALPGEERGHLHLGPGRKGLRIVERVIALDEDAREAVCQHLVNYLHGEQLERRGRRFFTRQDGRRRALTLEGARQLAVETALALDPHIRLSRPEVQRGIGASRASYLGNLEPGMSAHEKRTLGEAMAQEVVQDMSHPAERLALALVRHYRVSLTEEAKQFLRDHYGAREQVLNMIAQSHAEEMPQMNLLSQRPTVVPAPRRDWYRSLVRARRLLD